LDRRHARLLLIKHGSREGCTVTVSPSHTATLVGFAGAVPLDTGPVQVHHPSHTFAERHARAFTPVATPLTWEDIDDSSVLRTQVGDYLVARVT
jgi:hypothetical protein